MRIGKVILRLENTRDDECRGFRDECLIGRIVRRDVRRVDVELSLR